MDWVGSANDGRLKILKIIRKKIVLNIIKN